MNQRQIDFEDSLEEDDFGLIIGKHGELKGLFVPEKYEQSDYVPESIVQILTKVYGLDLEEQEVTIH